MEIAGSNVNFENLRQILDAFPGFVFAKNRSGVFTMVNNQLCEFYGKSEEELIGATDEILGYSPEEAEYFRKTDAAVFENKRSMRIPLNALELPSGEIRWFNIVKSPVLDANGEVDQVLVACYEITDRIKGEMELKESEEKFRDVFQNVSDAIFVIDKDGFFQEANREGNSLLGVRNATGMHIGQFVSEKSKSAPRDYIKLLDTKGVVHNFRVILDIDGVEKVIEINSTAIYDIEGKRSGSRDIIREITQRVQYEDQLIEAKRSAEDLNRLQANFLANMSHEIRTPINGIIGVAELIEQEFGQVEGLDEYTKLLKESGHRLLSTIVSILDFSRLNEEQIDLKLTDFDIVERIHDYLPSMQVLADKKKLYLKFGSEDEVLPFRFDENVLILILNNLIGNSIKFTKTGGIDIGVRKKMVKSKEYLNLTVSDSGIGIDKEFMPHLFEPFRQESTGLNRKYGGTGLGLSIVKKYVELFGGFIKVKSEKNEGTEFSLYLPLKVS